MEQSHFKYPKFWGKDRGPGAWRCRDEGHAWPLGLPFAAHSRLLSFQGLLALWKHFGKWMCVCAVLDCFYSGYTMLV